MGLLLSRIKSIRFWQNGSEDRGATIRRHGMISHAVRPIQETYFSSPRTPIPGAPGKTMEILPARKNFPKLKTPCFFFYRLRMLQSYFLPQNQDHCFFSLRNPEGNFRGNPILPGPVPELGSACCTSPEIEECEIRLTT